MKKRPLSRVMGERPMPPPQVVALATKIAAALAAEHEQGQLRREVKPADIWLTDDGDVELAAMELGALESLGLDEIAKSRTGVLAHDRQGPPMLIGALPYMSPEQLRGEPLDLRSTVFSFGVVLFEMIAGQRPFSGATSSELQDEILRARPALPTDLIGDVPEPLMNLLKEMLSAERADRPQTLQEVQTRLAQFSRPPRTPIPWKKMGVFVAGLVVVLGIGVGISKLPKPSTPVAQDNRVLVLPFEFRGATSDRQYLGQAYAESMAIALSQVKDLHVLPVPTDLDGPGWDRAKALGVSQVVQGSVTRDGSALELRVTLVQADDQRILFGTSHRGDERSASSLVGRAADDLAGKLGGKMPKLFEEISRLRLPPELSGQTAAVNALFAVRSGDLKTLLESTETLETQFPDVPDVRVLRAHAYLLRWDANPSGENRESFVSAIRRVEAVRPDDPYATFYRAYLAYVDKDYETSLRRFDQLLVRKDLATSARSWVLRYRAIAAGDQGRPKDAQGNLREAIHLDPTNARTLAILSELSLGIGELKDAETHARQAVALMPGSWRNHLTLGRVVDVLKRVDEASDAYGKACDLSQSQDPCALWALQLLRLGKTQEAKKAAASAAAMTAIDVAQYNLGCFWALSGDSDQAIVHLKAAVELGFRDPQVVEDPDLKSVIKDPRFRKLLPKFTGG